MKIPKPPSSSQIRVYHQSKLHNSVSPPLLEQFYAPSSSKKPQLTQQDLTKINLVIPRLCLSGHLTTAIRLTTTAFLTSPPHPPKSLSLSILIHSLTSQPDMAESISLLTILRRNPQCHTSLPPISTLLISSYVKRKRLKEAFKVYQWMLRPGCPFGVEKVAYEALVNGFCENEVGVEALRLLRDMAAQGFVPGDGLKRRLYSSLLRDARVHEALALDHVLDSWAEKLVLFLDSMIHNWTK